MTVTLIGLDADDTLWHNEPVFRAVQDRFTAVLAPHVSAHRIAAELEAVEGRNLAVYGYGVKGFTLSMIETALALAGDALPGRVVAEVLALGREMMQHPVEVLPAVEDAVARLSERGRLILVTKGDLFHQESKLAASGLGRWFSGVEIVSDKTPDTYRTIFARHGVAPDRAVMAGNSVRSDVLPPLAIGSYAALVAYPLVWTHEAAEPPHDHPRFRSLASLGDLPAWLDEIARISGVSG